MKRAQGLPFLATRPPVAANCLESVNTLHKSAVLTQVGGGRSLNITRTLRFVCCCFFFSFYPARFVWCLSCCSCNVARMFGVATAHGEATGVRWHLLLHVWVRPGVDLVCPRRMCAWGRRQ